MKTVAGFLESYSTVDKLGWPSDICYVLSNQKIYFLVEDSLPFWGIQDHIKSRGWKKIDSFVSQQGMYDV